MRVMVFGHKGFIGTGMVAMLKLAGHEVSRNSSYGGDPAYNFTKALQH